MEFQFTGYHSHPAMCDLKIAKIKEDGGVRVLVLVTELDHNPGTSVTNAAETLATQIYKKFLSDVALPHSVTFIEHYEGDRGRRPVMYDIVNLTWDPIVEGFRSPKWERLPQDVMEEFLLIFESEEYKWWEGQS